MITLIRFRHPTFYKIVQLSSHMLLSVNLVLVNPCIFERQNSIMLNY
jgi:hypothetical protein